MVDFRVFYQAQKEKRDKELERIRSEQARANAEKESRLKEAQSRLNAVILPVLNRAKEELQSTSTQVDLNPQIEQFDIKESHVAFQLSGPDGQSSVYVFSIKNFDKVTCTRYTGFPDGETKHFEGLISEFSPEAIEDIVKQAIKEALSVPG